MITAALHQIRIPFRKPFGHVIATRDHAEAIVLVLEAEGAEGVGECVPRPYVTGETFDSVWDAISGLDLTDVWAAVDGASTASLAHGVEALALPERLRARAVLGLAAGCAVELAVLDLRCKLAGWRLGELAFAMGLPAELLGEPPLPEVISVPLDLRTAPRELLHLAGSRLGHLKIKVGADLAADVQRVRECREIFGAAMSISVDANMAWSVEEALEAADALRPFRIAWYEEPLEPGARDRYRELRERGGVAVMLDEAACSFDQARRAIEAGACDLVNIRLSKCGGYLASLRLAALARSAGVRFQHGTQVGQLGFLNAAGRHFTSIVKGIVACEGGPGLANLSDSPTRTKLELDWSAGHLVGLSGPGHGASHDPEKLRAYSIRSAAWDGARWHHHVAKTEAAYEAR
jgi:L-alanine-DL-glutamate epimerase-like enolase superfamily enzyme